MDRNDFKRLQNVWAAMGRISVRQAQLVPIFRTVSRAGWTAEAVSALVTLHPVKPQTSIEQFCKANDAAYAQTNRNLSVADALSAQALALRAEFSLAAHLFEEYGRPGPTLHLSHMEDDMERVRFLLADAHASDFLARHYTPQTPDGGLSPLRYDALHRHVEESVGSLRDAGDALTGCPTPRALSSLSEFTRMYCDSGFDPSAESALTVDIQHHLLGSCFHRLQRMETRLMMDYGILYLRSPTRLEITLRENLRAGFVSDSKTLSILRDYCQEETQSLLGPF